MGPGRTEKDVTIEVFDLPENEDLISPSELDANKLYQKFREVRNELQVHFIWSRLATGSS